MIRHTTISLIAMLLASTAVQAQERIRSPEYQGDDAVESCFQWATGFEFEHCERLPVPGQPGVIGQTYTLADGSRRTLTVDPAVERAPADGPIDPLEAAANTGERPDFTPEEKPKPAMGSREFIGSAIENATSGRGDQGGAIATAPMGTDTLAASAGDDEGAASAESPTSAIVAEQFVLPPVVPTIPGRAEIMPMATGHLNRIETPFKNPMVRTSAAANALNVEFDQNYVYVSVTQPVTLFIHEKGHPDPAIVVSLVPQRIAPRQVKLTVPPPVMETIKKNDKESSGAGPNGTNTPAPNSQGIRRETASAGATNTLASHIKVFSQGRVPKGYQQIQLTGYEPQMFCKANGVTFSFRQGAAVASKDYIIVRGMAESRSRVTLDERWCALNPETLAVGFAPRTIIGPDQPTDFYVLIRRSGAAIQTAR